MFIGYGQIWNYKYRDEALRNLIETAPHSPEEFRTNGPLPHIAEFFQAFDIKEGDLMYLAPPDQIKIW